MKTVRHLAVALIFLVAPCFCFGQALVDLGWLRVSQTPEGWFVEKSLMLSATGSKLLPEDVVFSVDGRRIDNLNALTASNELNWIDRGANYVGILRKGSPLRLQLRPVNPLINGGMYVRRDVHLYGRNERIASLQIPDESGRPVTVKPGPGVMLMHFWSPT